MNNQDGQSSFALLLVLVAMTGFLFFRAESFLKWFDLVKQRHRSYLCAKSGLQLRERHSKEVVFLNKIIAGLDIAILIPATSLEATQARKAAQAAQRLSAFKYTLGIADNSYCHSGEKMAMSRPLFNFKSLDLSGTLSYQHERESFPFISRRHLLWATSDHRQGRFSPISFKFKTIDGGRRFGNSWWRLPSLTF